MDRVSRETRSRMMSAVRSESGIEILPKKFRGLYLRKHPKGILGKPDFGNKVRKIALFIDGCFWHKCPTHYRESQSNQDYWLPKIECNVQRDKEVVELLSSKGWRVIRVWEHDLKGVKQGSITQSR